MRRKISVSSNRPSRLPQSRSPFLPIEHRTAVQRGPLAKGDVCCNPEGVGVEVVLVVVLSSYVSPEQLLYHEHPSSVLKSLFFASVNGKGIGLCTKTNHVENTEKADRLSHMPSW